MVCIKLHYKTILVLFIAILYGLNSYAQLQLTNTDWKGVDKSTSAPQVNLHFGKDTLVIKNITDDKPLGVALFLQKHDTLVVFHFADKDNCAADTGYYQMVYQHSGQQLLLKPIKETCNYRRIVFDKLFSYIPDKNSARRDWLQLDATVDSVAGISLYKAYDLLKGRKSNTVIVAVIDNGFDISHEDLKNVIWTNTKEIPGNGLDDDHNGYADDVHGWNFRGDKNGRIVDNEQSGITQTYVKLKGQYENVDTTQLTGDEKKQFHLYKTVQAQYFDRLKDTKDSADLKYAYNLNYRSSELIYRDSPDPGNHFYGSAVITATTGLSHGTHVAGTIAAQRNNNKGIDGIADHVLIMPIIATTGIGDERDKDVANAILYAVNNGARIINMSFSKRFSPDKKLVDDAIRYAGGKKVLIIHAAGNEGNNNDTANYYPVAYYQNGKKAVDFITVGWSRSLFNYRLAHPNSGYGKRNVDLFAPGSDIFSTIPGDSYDYKSGSSMSTPCLTGVAALLLSYFPSLTAEQVKDILLQSSFKPDIMVNRPGSKVQVRFSSLSVSGGIVNAYNAVKMAIAITDKK